MRSCEFDGREIANFVLDHCEMKGTPVTNLSLQKIIYFCHVWSLIKLGRPLVSQKFEAWEHGPVLQYVYREFKQFGPEPITDRAKKLDRLTGETKKAEYRFDTEIEALLERVVDFYRYLSSGQLVDLCHVPGGPWERIWNHKGCVSPGMIIKDEEIIEFYSRASRPLFIQ